MVELSLQKAAETVGIVVNKPPAKRKSYYIRNPWLRYEPTPSEEWKDLCQACYKLYHTQKFPILVEDAVTFVLQNMETRKEFEGSDTFQDPKVIIGRWLSENFLIHGRQLRRNGSRSRFYVTMYPKKTADAVAYYGSIVGLGDDECL
jgi:hypothetical protein